MASLPRFGGFSTGPQGGGAGGFLHGFRLCIGEFFQTRDGSVLKSGFLDETLRAGDAVIIIGRTPSLPASLRGEVGREGLL